MSNRKPFGASPAVDLLAVLKSLALHRIDMRMGKLCRSVGRSFDAPDGHLRPWLQVEELSQEAFANDLSPAQRECHAAGIPFASYSPVLDQAAVLYGQLFSFSAPRSHTNIIRIITTDDSLVQVPICDDTFEHFATLQRRAHQIINELVKFKNAVLASSTAAPPVPPTLIQKNEGEMPARGEDDSAFRPAKEMLTEPNYGTYKALQKALNANPWIRTRRPRANRLLIHAGDWSKFLNSQSPDPLDTDAEVIDAVLAAQQRQDTIRQEKRGK